MSILLQQKNVGDYSYMSSPNIYYRAYMNCIYSVKKKKASASRSFLVYVE